MPPIAAMICGRSLRDSGGGSPSVGLMPPGRGHVSAEQLVPDRDMCPSASMPRTISPKRAIQSQIVFIGEPWICP